MMVPEGKGVTHLWGCGHGRRLVPQYMIVHPCIYGKHKLDSGVINNNKKRTWSWVEDKVGGIGRSLREVVIHIYDQFILYELLNYK